MTRVALMWIALSGRFRCAGWAGLVLLAACSATAGEWGFTPAEEGGFRFDTGTLRGVLRAGGASVGLQRVTVVETGERIDSSQGLLSHYRVFTRGRRYGDGAWSWPSAATLERAGGRAVVRVRWSVTDDRPFELEAVYALTDASTFTLTTRVRAVERLVGFESFVASYFTGAFRRAAVAVASAEVRDEAGGPGLPQHRPWQRAGRERGEWQMYPRRVTDAQLIQDGRWQLPPNPVTWTLRERFEDPPTCTRWSEGSTVVVSGDGACFALALPHETEAHHSLYLSLFGRDLEPGEQATSVVSLQWIPRAPL